MNRMTPLPPPLNQPVAETKVNERVFGGDPSLAKTSPLEQQLAAQACLIEDCNKELRQRFWLLSFDNKALEHGYIHQTKRFPHSFLWFYLLLSYLLFLSVIGTFLYFWPNPTTYSSTEIVYILPLGFVSVLTVSIGLMLIATHEPTQQKISMVACVGCMLLASNSSYFFNAPDIVAYSIGVSMGVSIYIAALNRLRGYYLLVAFIGSLLGNIYCATVMQLSVDFKFYIVSTTLIPAFACLVALYQDNLSRYRYLSETLMTAQRKVLEEHNIQLNQLAIKDHLTGLLNRRGFEEKLLSEWSRSSRSNSPITVMMIDIDNFKAYNDAYGHVKGDEVIEKIAHVISENVNRELDVSARYGGEEFIVILPHTPIDKGARLAQKICTSIQTLAEPHVESAHQQVVTVSIGIAEAYGSITTSPFKVVKDADAALYQSKQGGKNRVTVYSDE